MGLSKLDNLYRQVILDHSTHPHHHGTLPEATNEIELNNPTCGDVIQLQLRIEADVIRDIRFAGSGCTISMASASMMTDAVIGKSVAEGLALVETFSELVQGQVPTNKQALGDAQLLSGVAKFPARIKCATLGWKALAEGLTNEQATTVIGQLHENDKQVEGDEK